MRDSDWERLVRQLKAGKCAPFLGAGACYGHLRMARELAREWADEYEYPFEDSDDLARVMRYVALRMGDPVDMKEMFLERHFRGAVPPPFATDEPHAVLARFPIPLYLTTNYDDFMFKALQHAGRAPRQVLCPWYPGAPYSPDSFEPPPGGTLVQSPVVYHLHGHAGEPESLVLTEDDYIQFLVALGEDRHKEVENPAAPSLIPPVVQEALAARPLLFVGYSLRDWTFQVLLQGIIKAIPSNQKRSHISVQMLPVAAGASDAQRQRAEEFLNEYFADLKISVYWGSATDFFKELDRRAGGTP